MICRELPSPPKAKYRLLYAGADLGLMKFVQEALKADGWLVVRCPDGSMAKALLKSRIRYDLLMFDSLETEPRMPMRKRIRYDLLMFDEVLPGRSGGQLVRLARSLEHRRETPVILLSRRAEQTGAQPQADRRFRLKPKPYQAVVETIKAQD
jgi:DNA-binding response OmpR family regulator